MLGEVCAGGCLAVALACYVAFQGRGVVDLGVRRAVPGGSPLRLRREAGKWCEGSES